MNIMRIIDMPRQNKYAYLLVLQGNYGQGWEDLTAEIKSRDGLRRIRNDKKAYTENAPCPLRIVERRQLNRQKLCPL